MFYVYLFTFELSYLVNGLVAIRCVVSINSNLMIHSVFLIEAVRGE